MILKCLEKDKEERFQNSNEACSELINIEKGFPTTDRMISPKKSAASKKITISLSLKKFFVPALVVIAAVIIVVIILRPVFQKESISLTPESISILSEKSAPLRVKVIIDNASIKATPEIGGKTMARVSLNTVLDIEEKLGEWFKVYIEIEGVQISGFIHEMLVEEESESIKVCVIVDNATIKTTPDIAGTTIATVPLNAVLEVKSRQKEWYEVYWEKDRIKSTGFIHEMLVEVVR